MSDLPADHVAPLRIEERSLLNWLHWAIASKAETKALLQSRDKLATYDDRLLRDVGMSREQALGRARRPDWAVPDWWMARAR